MTHYRPLAVVLSAVLAPAVVGCGSSYEEQASEYQACLEAQRTALRGDLQASKAAPNEDVALMRVDSENLAQAVRDRLKTEAKTSLDVQRVEQLAYARCRDKIPTASRSSNGAMASSADSSGKSQTSPAPESGATSASGTNNQVAGVDEADFVKNDNEFIYIADGSAVRIVDAWPASEMHEVSRVSVNGEVKKLFVTNDRVVVFSSAGAQSAYGRYGGYGASGDCTYGYGCVPRGDGRPTTISVFDITDRAKPTLLRTLETSSSLIAARRVGNMIHAVVSQEPSGAGAGYGYGAYGYGYGYGISGSTEADVERSYAAAVDKMSASIDALEPKVLAPTTRDGAGNVLTPTIWQSPTSTGVAFTSVISFDLASSDVSQTAVLGSPGWIYASGSAIYMASSASSSAGYYSYASAKTDRSVVHKFAIGDSPLATSYRASGLIDGHVINQFAMDEKEGRLRVATSSGHVPDPGAHSSISVLEEAGAALFVAGKIGDIAKGEDIRSVRFDGDRGYIVTFKKTDPLFAFDLKDPHAPRMLGELKIPGFSTYMHMMDETHLLTIGYDAADQGSFAYFTGVLLQIFDVTDPTQPKLAHKEVIGTRGSSSEALTNHLAFNWFAPKGLLALPMTICEGGNTQGGYGDEMTFSGLMVYDATATNGFSLRGRVDHASQQSLGGATCSNWWTNASSEVKRSIFMDDVVFSISDHVIKANALSNLGADLAVVPLTGASTGQ